ncbi:MAG TPA: HEAT repeat domain-containing protein [Deltaproteobacteria bacterium]|nr:HEAT repeat domain-containing protein [Deltaproteobacteria bacterium]
MSKVHELEHLIAQGDWQAVDLTAHLGEAAWPAIEQGARMENFQSRQISMVCAGRLGGETAGTLLLAGLADNHINVSLAAAGQLSRNPPPSALHGILGELAQCQEENICALLALGVGHLPGEASMNALLELTGRDDDVAKNARLALAKLGHDEYLEALLAELASDDPHARYEALAQLVYIDDAKLGEHAKKLLYDKEVAVTIGKQYAPRYRRVCDQAVDTLAALLKLKLPFAASAESIYSDSQLAQVREMVK